MLCPLCRDSRRRSRGLNITAGVFTQVNNELKVQICVSEGAGAVCGGMCSDCMTATGHVTTHARSVCAKSPSTSVKLLASSHTVRVKAAGSLCCCVVVVFTEVCTET